MKNYTELKTFYFLKVVPKLREFEKVRLQYNREFKIYIIITVLLAISFMLFASIYYYEKASNKAELYIDITSIVVLTFVTSIIYIWKLRRNMKHDFNVNYKYKIVDKIIELLNEDIYYEKNGFLTFGKVYGSFMFNGKVTFYSGEDLLYGTSNSVSFAASDISCYVYRKRYSILPVHINGFMVISDLNKNIDNLTIIQSEFFEKKFGTLVGKKLNDINATKYFKQIRMDNIEFEREFTVYSSDNIEARYLLPHNIMENILQIKEISEQDIIITFNQNKIYLFIKNFNIFNDINLNEPIDYENLFDQFYFILNITLNITKQLNLDRNIYKI